MLQITLKNERLASIVRLLDYPLETAKPLAEFVEALLRRQFRLMRPRPSMFVGGAS